MKNEKFQIEFQKRLKLWTVNLIKFLGSLQQTTVNKIIVNQLIRSGTSIGANFAEAQAAPSPKDFLNFMHYALKSANESIYWLDLLQSLEQAVAAQINPIINELNQIAKILGSSIVTLKRKIN